MFGIGTSELLIILVVIFLLFGAKRLPELGRGLGEGMRSFRDALKGQDPQNPPPSTPPVATTQPPQNGDKPAKS